MQLTDYFEDNQTMAVAGYGSYNASEMAERLGCVFVESPDMESEDNKELYLKLRYATGVILYPIFCVFGLAGNILSLVVLSHPKMRNSTHIYLQALALSDSVKLLSDLLYFVTSVLYEVHPPAGDKSYAYLYPRAHYLFHMSVLTTAWLTVSVAVERYIMVCHATKAKQLCNVFRARVVCVSVFVASMLVCVPLALRYKTIHVCRNGTNGTNMSVGLDVGVTDLWKKETFVLVYKWFQNVLQSIIPLLTLCVLTFHIIRALRRSRATGRRAHLRNRISTMLISVIFVFLICITPDAIMSTCFGFGYTDATYRARAIREVTDLLLLVNSSVNFVLYCTFNHLFRAHFVAIFCKQHDVRPGVTGQVTSTLMPVRPHTQVTSGRRGTYTNIEAAAPVLRGGSKWGRGEGNNKRGRDEGDRLVEVQVEKNGHCGLQRVSEEAGEEERLFPC